MPQVSLIKRHLLNKRAKIIKFLKKEGYPNADIAIIFSIDPSVVTRILVAEKNYKEFAKLELSDKKSFDR